MDNKKIAIAGSGFLAASALMSATAREVNDLAVLLDPPRRKLPATYYDGLLAEYELIKAKQSTLSRRQRDKIVAEAERIFKTGKPTGDESN